MLLQQIFEGTTEISRAEQELTTAKEALRVLMQSAGAAFQSGASPQYAQRITRAKRALTAASDKLANAQSMSGIASQAGAKFDVNDEELGKSNKSTDEWESHRLKNGGDKGLNKCIAAAAMKQTDDGTHELNVTQLAQHFGVRPRAMSTRLKEPDLFQTAMLMPKNK